MDNEQPIVSVCIFTYNHEKYIEQCIESVLMQKTDFYFEIILGEDYSDDRTREICQNYVKINSNVRLLDRGKNLKLAGNYYDTLKQAKGKYIAILDGDDFWIDPFKLQKQYNYLEENSEINICFHQVIRTYEPNYEHLDFFVKVRNQFFSLEDIIEKWIMATGSIFFRSSKMDFPSFLLQTINFDLAIQLILLRDNSKAGFINDIMSVYRVNLSSNSYNILYNDYNSWNRLINLFEEFNIYTEHKYESIIQKKNKTLRQNIKTFTKQPLINHIKSILKKVIFKFGYKIIDIR